MNPKRPSNPLISIVIPVYNEEDSLHVLYERVSKVVRSVTDNYEFILVNDGSRDRSFEIMKEFAKKDPHVRAVDLSRNFGHQLCLTAGLDTARGDVVMMMDADLQDPPELLPKMLKKWRAGADVVYAVRKKRKGETFMKLFTAALYYRLLRFCTKIAIPLDTGDFRLIDRTALDALLSVRESNRFLRGLFAWIGFKQEPIYYVRQERFAGETKYPFRKMFRLALDGITSFSAVPLQLAMWVGLISAMLSLVYLVWVAYLKITGQTVQGWASILLAVLFLGGVQLVTIGLLGEYIGRIFDEVKNRPLYFIREIVDQDEEDSGQDESAAKQPQSE